MSSARSARRTSTTRDEAGADVAVDVLSPPGTHLHLIGVCGTGMTPLALALRAQGWRVTGEDKHWPEETAHWLQAGGVERMPTGELPSGAVRVIHSSAVGPTHPTRAVATSRGVASVRRGEALAALVRDRKLIAVVGSHGKTTTTAMLAIALREIGVPCDHLLGGLFADGRTPPAVWRGEGWVVAEIDESDGTIGGFSPEITLCVNVDWDHCDQYRQPEAIEHAFAALAARTRRAVFFHAACAWSRRIFPASGGKAERASFGAGGDFTLEGAISRDQGGQTLRLGGRFSIQEAQLVADGAFNANNATGALAVAAWLGATQADRLSTALAAYPGVRRRQAALPARAGVTVIEDYAHHPAEIEALLTALRARGPRRLVAVFQPHRHSRTAQFKEDFARVLATADRVFLLEVYAAGEARVAGGDSSDVLAELQRRDNAPPAELLPRAESAAEEIAAQTREGDLLLFVGAGDIDVVARETSRLLSTATTAAASPSRRETFLRTIEGRLGPETVVRVDEPLGPKTTLRVGGRAEIYAEPANTADLQTLLAAARANELPAFLLGRGSNLIVVDEGVSGLVLRLQHSHWRRLVCLGPRRYWAGAGLRLRELCGAACRMGESGFEFLEGIPGTVGGALRMNAGAMGGWMFDVVEQVHFLDANGSLHIRSREEMHVDYRHCAELVNGFAIGAVLRAQGAAESAQIKQRLAALQQQRQASQPREPSAGCIFKNPPGDFAGRIIDELGLKGLRIGDAQVSEVHGNFFINRGNATGADVIELVRRVRDEVRTRKHIELEPEVMLCGRKWQEVLQ